MSALVKTRYKAITLLAPLRSIKVTSWEMYPGLDLAKHVNEPRLQVKRRAETRFPESEKLLGFYNSSTIFLC